MPSFSLTSGVVVAALAALAVPARGQCATAWTPGAALGGCDLTVAAAIEWDPDGGGPRTPVLVLGGGFTTAGDAPANRVAAFDPATGAWSRLGTGITGSLDHAAVRVFALVVLPNGDLVAGGAFTTAGGVAASCVARWDGVAWSPLGSGLDGAVLTLCVLPNGDLVAGGRFGTAGGVPVQRAARWNGLAWSALGNGPGTAATDAVTALTVRNGELIAGRRTLTSPPVDPVSRWNGVAWSPVGVGLTGDAAALVTLPNGEVVAGGAFALGGGPGVHGVLRWNGTAWAPFGASLSVTVAALCPLASGELVALGGDGRIHRGDGATWSTIGAAAQPGSAGNSAVQLHDGALVVGGTFDAIDDVPMACVGAWNGASWSPLGGPVGPRATWAATCVAGGDVVVASTTVGGAAISTRIHRRQGSSWTQLGPDFDGLVHGLATAANGDVLACGSFTALGGVPIARIARWNGSAWTSLGSGPNAPVAGVLALANGDVVAVGDFDAIGGVPAIGIARWNGSTWAAFAGGAPGAGSAVVEAANGDLIASWGSGPSRVQRWNGAAWSPLGALAGQVHALAELPNGDVVAGGTALVSNGVVLNHIARWNGTAWLPLGSGLGMGAGEFSGASIVAVRGVVALPAGDVIAVGTFGLAGGVPARGAARWDGAAWTPLATIATGLPRSLARAPNGDLVLSGVDRMDDTVSAGFARLTTTCPATAVATGPGCDGDSLAAASLPWAGAVFVARANGLPAAAVALDVLGFATTSVPLAALLPQAGPGCALAVSPDAVAALVPIGGALTTQLAIPNNVALAGIVVHEQVLALGLGAGGAVATFTGTNRLTLTIGVY